ncbi:hypothetical protein BC830DRAFT_1105861 [Chytriomyces sp. MP71]|nr:hypothetical protein BC830DRAFT_1105861 [Chytriomyces sp. MP71]
MFGCIIAGRLVQTNLQQVGETKFVFELPDAKSINHIVVFLTGASPFPQGYGATVHFLWPNPSAPPTWQMLGLLSNEKPSAVFKLGQRQSNAPSGDAMMDDSNGNLLNVEPPITASLGISIEPIDFCMRAVETAKSDSHISGSEMVLSGGKTGMADPQLLGSKLLENLFNYCAGFASAIPTNGNALFGRDWNTTYVPLKAIQDWYQSMQRKFKIDPSGSFLKN